MGIELAKMFVSVGADTGQLEPDLRGAQGMVKGIFSDMRTYIAGALIPLAKFGDDFLRRGAAMSASNEVTRVKFETMLGSIEETEDTLKRLTAFAAATSFEMPQLKQVTEGLIQFGERGDELFETLKILGDASGGTAQDFQTLGLVYNQVRGVGKLLTQDFRQLSTRGIISLKDLAKHYKVTSEEAQGMISTGKVSFEDLRAILKGMTEEGGRMANMMEKQSQTIDGLASTYSDALNILGTKVSGVLDPGRKQVMKMKIAFVEMLDAAVTNTDGFVASAAVGSIWASKLGVALFATGVAAKFMGISIRGAIMGTGIGAIIIALGAGLGLLANAMSKNSNAGIYMAEIGENLMKVWESLSGAAGRLGMQILEIFGADIEGFTDDIWGFAIAFSAMLVTAAGHVEDFVDDVTYWWRNLWSVSTIMAIDFFLWLAEKLGVTDDFLVPLASAFMGLWEGATAGMLAFWENYKAATAIGISLVGHLMKAFQRMFNFVAENWQKVGGLTTAFIQGDFGKIAALSHQLAEGLALEVGLQTQEAINDASAIAVEQAKNPIDEFVNGFAKGTGDALKKFDIDGGPLAVLETARDALQAGVDQSEYEREMMNLPFVGPQLPGDDKKDDEKDDGKKGFDLGIDSGRFGFAAFGSKLQDAMLKDDKQGQMVDLLGQGNQIQKDILEENKKDKPAKLGP